MDNNNIIDFFKYYKRDENQNYIVEEKEFSHDGIMEVIDEREENNRNRT